MTPEKLYSSAHGSYLLPIGSKESCKYKIMQAASRLEKWLVKSFVSSCLSRALYIDPI